MLFSGEQNTTKNDGGTQMRRFKVSNVILIATHNYLLADFTHVTCKHRGDGTAVTQESGYCPERS
jgi:hypothetical protein